MCTTATKTLRVRIKDKQVPVLRRMAREVNAVWNYCNQANRDHWRKHRRHLTGFDLNFRARVKHLLCFPLASDIADDDLPLHT